MAPAPPEDLRVVTVLDRGVERANALGHDPEIQAELYRTLGGSYEQLGKYEHAKQLLDSALKLDQASAHPNDLRIADDCRQKPSSIPIKAITKRRKHWRATRWRWFNANARRILSGRPKQSRRLAV